MNKTLLDLYDTKNQLEQLINNFDNFYSNWVKLKCKEYNKDTLSHLFDSFFSLFVAYNALYSTFNNMLERFDGLKKKRNSKGEEADRGDREMAIDIISKNLSQTNVELFFSKTEIIESINSLIDIIENEKFAIIHKHGEPQINEDKKLLHQLRLTNNKIKIKALLTALYNIRCNMFHGSKNFEAEQKLLLKPINKILFEVIEMTYSSFKTKVEELRAPIEASILLEEKNKS